MILAKKILALAVMLAAWPLFSQTTNRQPAVPERPSVAQVLEQLERDWANAVVRRDTNAIHRIQADEFTFVDPSGRVWSKARAQDYLQAGRLRIDSFELSEMSVHLYEHTAVVRFRIVWTGTSEGMDISGPQVMTDVFVERDGRWQCVASHATRIGA